MPVFDFSGASASKARGQSVLTQHFTSAIRIMPITGAADSWFWTIARKTVEASFLRCVYQSGKPYCI